MRKISKAKTGRRTADIVRSYRDIKDDYAAKCDIMDEDSAFMRHIKWVVAHCLTPADRTIIILYAETASYRKLGKRLGLSHTTVKNEVHRIRQIIIDNL